MKLIHLSDLHLGKRVNEVSMLEDQAYVLEQIFQMILEEEPDGLLIAGDIYDKSIATTEAILLCDEFLCRMAEQNIPVFLISGNHDSAERMAFGSRLMCHSGIYIAPAYGGVTEAITLEDAYGPVDIYLLPFIKPTQVRRYFPEKEIVTYTDAVSAAISQMQVDTGRRNIIVTHQFVTGGIRSDSEESSVGGTDLVDYSVFQEFDYVALGHLHKPQNIGTSRIRYCGTPLKYSFSEVDHEKSLTIVELGKKGELDVRTRLLYPKHDMKKLRGTYLELMSRSFYEGVDREDYLDIILEDEEMIPDAISKLRLVYPNLMKVEYDNTRTRSQGILDIVGKIEQKTPLELFMEFYEKQNNQPMQKQQAEYMKQLIEEIQESEE